MSYQRTGKRPGRPTREERRIAYQTKLEGPQPILGPPIPPGLRQGRNKRDWAHWDRLIREAVKRERKAQGWGGSRAGSGRKKKEGGSKNEFVLVRVSYETKLRLERLPEGGMADYLREAIQLMIDIMPPEKFRVTEPEETKLVETAENHLPGA